VLQKFFARLPRWIAFLVPFTVAAQSVAPSITSATRAEAMVGETFAYTITASAPAARNAFNLPGGFSWNAETGTFTGIPHTTGVFTIELTATNSGGTGRATLTLTVVPSTAPPTITNTLLEYAVTVGTQFGYSISATYSPTSYAAAGLPAGLTLDSERGTIQGAATVVGTFDVQLRATNPYGTGTATLRLIVTPPTLPVLTSPLRVSTPAQSPFEYQIAADAQPRARTFFATGLPAGLSVHEILGTIRGTPTTPGTYSVTISAENPAGRGSATLELTVTPPIPVITSPLTADAKHGAPFTFQVTATNSPTRFAAESIPSWLRIDAATGALSGTPQLASFSNPQRTDFTLLVSNAYGTARSSFSILIALPDVAPPQFANLPPPPGYVGVPYRFAVAATNSPTLFSAANLPPGLSVGSRTGVVSGTPTREGYYNENDSRITVSNASGEEGHMWVQTIWGPPKVGTVTFSGPTLDPFLYWADAPGAVSFSATGLAPGLTLDPATGRISGAITAAGNFVINLTARNPAGTGTGTVTLNVAEKLPPQITSTAVATGQVGIAFRYRVTTTNSPDSLVAANLPPGLSLDVWTWEILGTPTTAGRFVVALSATNRAGTGTRDVTIDIGGLPLPTISVPAVVATVGTSLTWTMAATPSVTSYSTTTLPPGLALNATSGVISGTPTRSGDFTFTYTATNAAGPASKVVNLHVNDVPSASGNISATPVSPTEIRVAWAASPGATYYRLERSTSGALFTEVLKTTDTACNDYTLHSGISYSYRVVAVERRLDGEGTSAPIDSIVVATPRWNSTDVGAVAVAGSFTQETDRITVRGSGADIWENNDEFHFVSYSWTGDGVIVARLGGIELTDSWAKQGVMIRENSTAGARYAMVSRNPVGQVTMQTRTSAGGSATASHAPDRPEWVKLVRRGREISGYTSVDGARWNALGTATLALPSTVQIGLAVTSHRDGVLAAAAFHNVSLSSTWNPQAPPAPANFTAVRSGPGQIDLSWTDLATDETEYVIEYATSDDRFVYDPNPGANNLGPPRINVLARLPAGTQRFSSTGWSASPFHFRIHASARIDHGGNFPAAESARVYASVPAITSEVVVPAAPSALIATASSTTQVELRWAGHANSETGFQLERAPAGGNFSALATLAANLDRYTDNGLTAATAYSYRVRAVAGTVTSPYSNIADVTTATGTTAPSRRRSRPSPLPTAGPKPA